MRKRNFWEIICITGLPWFIILFAAGYAVESWYWREFYRRDYVIRSLDDVSMILIISGCFWIYVLVNNLFWLDHPQKIGLFTWRKNYKYEPPEVSLRRKRAQHPPVADEYLSDEPDGLVLGTERVDKKKMYVRFPISKDHALSAIILGLPGSGKSTLLLTSIIYQMHQERKKGEPRPVYFLLDVKPELMRKSVSPKSKYMKELSITKRSKYGWDVYFNLDSCSCDDEILSELDVIARALIEAPKGGGKNEFFYESARAIFKFLCLADYKKGKSFMDTIDFLLDANISDTIKTMLDEAKDNAELIKVRRGLNAYDNKDDAEAFQGIEMAFRQSMDIFQKDNTRYFLDGNPRKVSPMTLEDKVSIAYTITLDQIKEYKTIARLVIMQLLHHCEKREEDRSHLITLIIDEAYRLGLINWIDFLSVCRSKQVSCVLAFQSLSQMQSVWSKEDADSLIEMVSAIAVLSCKSKITAEMICSWAGEYKEEKITINKGGQNGESYSITYEDKPILKPYDLMKLKRSKEVILFLDGEYYRVNVEKARYFKIPELKKISKECVKAHKMQKEE